MDNSDSANSPAAADAVEMGMADPGLHRPPPSPDALSLDPQPQVMGPAQPQERNYFRRLLKRLDVILLVLLVLGGAGLVLFALARGNNTPAKNASEASQYGTISLPLDQLIQGKSLTVPTETTTVTINGPMQLNSGLRFAPSPQPGGALPGQLYFDQGTSQLAYYNGSSFVFLSAPEAQAANGVQGLGGLTGQIDVGTGLTTAGGRLSATGVLSLLGQSGNVTLTAGSGIAIGGTTISNTGLLSLTSGSSSLTVATDADGNAVITSIGAGTVGSPNGTVNRIAKFTGAQTIADSLLSDDGATVTVGGALTVSGALTLSTALPVGSGGTGAATLASNGVLVGQGTGAITSVTAGGSGQCLLSTGGAPAFGSCPGGGAAVTSLNGLTGALNLANATGSGATVTINDATTAAKGIASFNAANFTVGSGAVNTIQNIGTGATPTFAGVNTNAITPSGALTLGGTAQNVVLQGAVTTITATNGGTTNTLGFTTPSGVNKTITVPNATGTVAVSATGPLALDAAGNLTCLSCVTSGGGGGGVGAVDSLNGLTGTLSIANASGSGATITINDATTAAKGIASFNATNFSVAAGAVNTVQNINTTASPTFTAVNTNTITPSGAFTAGAIGQTALLRGSITTITSNGATNDIILDSADTIELQDDTNVTGNVVVSGNVTANGNTTIGNAVSDTLTITALLQGGTPLIFEGAAVDANQLSLAVAALTGDQTITLPDETGTVCLRNSSNCGFALSSGSGNYIQNQNAAQQTANFWISGTGRADTALQATLFDTPTAAALTIGTTNATSITLQKDVTLAANKNLTLTGVLQGATATFSGSASADGLAVSNSTSTNNIAVFRDNATNVLTIADGGAVLLQNAANSTAAFNIKNASPTSGNVFTVDTANARVGIGLSGNNVPTLASGVPGLELQGALRLSGTSGMADLFVANTGNVGARINIPFYAYSAGGQGIAIGVDSASNVSSRGLTVFDARNSGAHQPSIGVTSVDEQKIFGLSWEGLSANGYLKTNGASGIYISPNATDAAAFTTSAVNLLQDTIIAASKTFTVTSALTTLTGATSGDALNVSNSTSTGNIAIFKDNATAVLTIGDGGATTLQNETNQLSALKILTTVATSSHIVFNADTTNERVGIGGLATASKLEVLGGNAAIYNNGADPKLFLGDSTAGGQNGFLMWDSTNDYIRIEPVGTNGLKIADNALTIGNLFPDEPLKVANGSTLLAQVNTTGAAKFQNSSDSATAFQVLNSASAGGTATFTVDTSGSRVLIGVSDAAATQLVLDTRSAAGDPTGANGAMYYNSNSQKFRCFQNSAWTDCIAADTLQTAYDNGATITTTNAAGDVRINLADTATDANFFVDLQCDTSCSTTGRFIVADDGTSVFHIDPGTSNGSAWFQVSGDVTDAFNILNAAGTRTLFRVDTFNERVYIGNLTADTTGALLVLDNKNTAGDPSGVEGGLYFNTAYDDFRCYSGGSWNSCSAPNIDRTFMLQDEFLGGNTSGAQIGELGWKSLTFGAGSSVVVYNTGGVTPSADHPGIIRLKPNDTSPASNSLISLALNSNTGTADSTNLAVGNTVKTTAAVGSSASSSQTFRVGLFDQSDLRNTNNTGVWWEADPTTNANWRYCYVNGGATTVCAASGAAIAANSFVRLAIRVNSLGTNTSSVTFTINGTPSTVSGVTVNTTNLVNNTIGCLAQTATNRDCYVDYYQFTGIAGAAR